MRSGSVIFRRLRGAALALAVTSALGACSEGPTDEQCEALLDKVIELEIATAGTDKLPAAMKEDLEKQRAQLEDYLSEKFMAECRKNVPLEVVKCGLKAKTKADYAACDKE